MTRASMGPRSIDRGIWAWAARGRAALRLQWGRDRSIAELLVLALDVFHLKRFNGAAIDRSRNSCHDRYLRRALSGFNGAAIDRSRNCATASQRRSGGSASMGPRSIDRGIEREAGYHSRSFGRFNGAAIDRS